MLQISHNRGGRRHVRVIADDDFVSCRVEEEDAVLFFARPAPPDHHRVGASDGGEAAIERLERVRVKRLFFLKGGRGRGG